MCAGLMIDYKKTLCTAHLKILAKKEKVYFSTMEIRGRYRHRDRNRSRNRYRKHCMIGRLCFDAGSAMMPKSIPIAIPIPIPTVSCVPSQRRECQTHAFQESSLYLVAAIGCSAFSVFSVVRFYSR